ncbi:MAG: DUF4213 and DUF364 domain-containing protein [Candidatus Alkanophagales archaeon MCA70_species_2]|nr:DUF4213 and DUF364 domain-containing protein [Candidatus Alkanophaga liquidiphilum]
MEKLSKIRLVEDLISEVEELETPTEDVRVGLRLTAVKMRGMIGLAYTFKDWCPPPRGVGKLIGAKTVALARSWNMIEAAVGCASVNALLSSKLKPTDYERLEITQLLFAMAPDFERIGVVGKFPFVGELKRLCKEVYVFERRPREGTLPDAAAEELLPRCDFVVISGSAFVNKTLQRLLELSGGFTVVAGPSTPLSKILFEYGADALAGITTNAAQVLNVVSQGGGRKELKAYIELVCMKNKRK